MPGEPRACPMCQYVEFDTGEIVGRSPGVKFKTSRDIFGDLVGTPITSGIFNHSALAFRCRRCGTVVVPPARD